MKRIKVMVVDDSALVRQVAGALLRDDPAIAQVTVAADPLQAMARMRDDWPDVIVLDLDMPRMDGMTFLKKIMCERATPVIICSTLVQQGARASMEALAAGAVSVIAKPALGLKQFLHDAGDDLVGAVKAAACANVRRLGAPAKLAADAVLAPPAGHAPAPAGGRVVAIGTSTGGTQALEQVLTALPPACPGIVIVQHMPEKFTGEFAARLNGLARIAVREARHGEPVLPGQALIAPGGRHLLLRRDGPGYAADVIEGPLVNRHRPSVDVLFRSVAKSAGAHALGIIMTGMGDDGAAGLLEMRKAGARTLAQDEHSCVVYGMPREAVRRGAAERSVALAAIAREIVAHGALAAA